MLTILLGLLSSAGFGSIIGLAGGILNRLIDIKGKSVDMEFELKKMDKEKEFMKEEYEGRLVVATTEANARIESSAYEALGKSYSFAQTTTEDGLVDKVTKTIRPLLTVAFFIFTVYVFYKINSLMLALDIKPNPTEVLQIWKQAIEWIFFQAGVSIGWWFAMRPGKMPTFSK